MIKNIPHIKINSEDHQEKSFGRLCIQIKQVNEYHRNLLGSGLHPAQRYLFNDNLISLSGTMRQTSQ